MIITKTPFRISFFGGGTDYPGWYRQHGGAALATAIDKYCYITCRYLPPFFEHHSRIIYSRIENVAANAAIEHPAVRACLAQLGVTEGVEIHHDADLPARTGLGTSSAFVVGLLHALYALRQQRCERASLARQAIEIERDVLRESVGVQDQMTSAFGGFNVLRFLPGDQLQVEPLIAPPARFADLQEHLHLYFTGFVRTASEIAQHQIQNIPDRGGELREMRAMVEEGAGILADPARSMADFGRLLHRGWELKRTLSHRVSTAAVDAVYERARAAGALGGKLLGAGGGGFMLFFVPPERRGGFVAAMKPLLRVPFHFAAKGSELTLYESSDGFDQALAENRTQAYGQSA